MDRRGILGMLQMDYLEFKLEFYIIARAYNTPLKIIAPNLFDSES